MSISWIIIASGNGLSHVQHQAINQTITYVSSIGPLGTVLDKVPSQQHTGGHAPENRPPDLYRYQRVDKFM